MLINVKETAKLHNINKTEEIRMNKKIVKTLSLACLILLFSVNMAFANDNVTKNSQTDANIMAGTIFSVNGGHGEWGYGLFNMWGKYWHTTKSHRVILIKDNSYIYGAWEDGGPTESYRETSKGSNMNHSVILLHL